MKQTSGSAVSTEIGSPFDEIRIEVPRDLRLRYQFFGIGGNERNTEKRLRAAKSTAADFQRFFEGWPHGSYREYILTLQESQAIRW